MARPFGKNEGFAELANSLPNFKEFFSDFRTYQVFLGPSVSLE